MSLKLRALATQEVAAHAGFTHMASVTADDLTITALATGQTLNLGTIPKGAIIQKAEARLQIPLQSTDGAVTTTMSLGDAGNVARHLAAFECHQAGTEITVPVFTNVAYGPLAADTPLLVTVSSPGAGKALSLVNVGEVHFFVQILDTKILSDSKPGLAITTK